MYAQITSIKNRLQAALGTPWVVVDGTEPQDRRDTPRADVRLSGATFKSASGPGVTLQPQYLVRLVVDAGAEHQPFALLDAAFDAAIASLHNWRPQGATSRLALQGVAAVESTGVDLFGYDLGFVLTTTRQGCND